MKQDTEITFTKNIRNKNLRKATIYLNSLGDTNNRV